MNPVELLCRAGLAESSHAKHVFFEKDGERVAVYGLAGVPEEYAKAAIERLAPKPADGVFSIFMFHQNLKELMPVVEHGLMMEDLPEGFNLYIDGHIHKNQELKKGGMHLLIPGSTVLTQLRREEGAKGYYVYDTAARTAEFREISTRPFHFVRIIKGPLPLKDAALAALSGVDFSTFPIVRVELEGVFPREEVRLLADAYREKCHMFISGGNDGEVEGVEDAGSALGLDAPTIRERGLIILKEAAVRNGLAGLDVEALLESACEGDDEKAVSHFISSARQRGFEKAE